MAENYCDKIKSSNLYNFLNNVDVGEATFNDEQERINEEDKIKNFLMKKCPYDLQYEKIKYSLYVLYNLGYEYLINDYLNIGKSSFVTIYNFTNAGDLKIGPNLLIECDVKISGKLSKVSVSIDVAYDYIFCKFYKEKKIIDLKDKNLFDDFDNFKKNYIQK
jgi:hypothetical protein